MWTKLCLKISATHSESEMTYCIQCTPNIQTWTKLLIPFHKSDHSDLQYNDLCISQWLVCICSHGSLFLSNCQVLFWGTVSPHCNSQIPARGGPFKNSPVFISQPFLSAVSFFGFGPLSHCSIFHLGSLGRSLCPAQVHCARCPKPTTPALSTVRCYFLLKHHFSTCKHRTDLSGQKAPVLCHQSKGLWGLSTCILLLCLFCQ